MGKEKLSLICSNSAAAAVAATTVAARCVCIGGNTKIQNGKRQMDICWRSVLLAMIRRRRTR